MDERWMQGVLLLATRLGAFVLVAPPLASVQLPPTVRVSFVLVMSLMLVVGLPVALPVAALSMDALVPAACGELALGLTMALGVAFAFAAFAAGAQVLDLQIGFGMGQIFDPLTRRRVPVLTSAFSQLAVVSFFATDSHLAMMRGLAWSLERFPVGQAGLSASFVPVLLRQSGALFTLGFAMVAPVVFCLFLVDLGLGVLARSLPQMNMFALGIPVKVVVGLVALTLWLLMAAPVVARTHASIFSGWKALLP